MPDAGDVRGLKKGSADASGASLGRIARCGSACGVGLSISGAVFGRVGGLGVVAELLNHLNRVHGGQNERHRDLDSPRLNGVLFDLAAKE